MNHKTYCTYANCKNTECDKLMPKELCMQFIRRGGIIQFSNGLKQYNPDSPSFLIWSQEQLVNGKPHCYKK